MEDWQKDFFEMVEAVAEIVDEFFVGVTETVEAIAEQMQTAIATDLDQCLQQLFEPIAELYSDFEDIGTDADLYFTYTGVEPSVDKHPACIGCRHYHGQVYSGNLLVCAMHPYGWDDNNCPDWESNWPDFN